MGKARDLFKKIGDTKGPFHARMGTIKDRSDKDLTEAEEVARIHRTIHKGSKTCTGGSDQNHPQGKEMQEGKAVV